MPRSGDVMIYKKDTTLTVVKTLKVKQVQRALHQFP